MISILVVFNIIYSAFATIYIDGPCSNITVVKNFNLTSFTQGIWYEIARYPNNWEANDDCAYLDFDKENDDLKKKSFKIGGVIKNRPNILRGYVDFTPGVNDGIVYFHSTSFEGEQDLLTVYVLDTDYDNYLIAYECKYDEATKVRHDYVWIDSRKTSLDSATKKLVDNFITKSKLIDAKNLIWEHFTDDLCKVK